MDIFFGKFPWFIKINVHLCQQVKSNYSQNQSFTMKKIVFNGALLVLAASTVLPMASATYAAVPIKVLVGGEKLETDVELEFIEDSSARLEVFSDFQNIMSLVDISDLKNYFNWGGPSINLEIIEIIIKIVTTNLLIISLIVVTSVIREIISPVVRLR